MNIEDPVAEFADDRRRNLLQVASEHDEIDPVASKDFAQSGFVFLFSLKR